MQVFVWVKVEKVDGLYKFIKGQIPTWDGEWYETQPAWAPLNDFCQVLIDYNDYVRIKDLKAA